VSAHAVLGVSAQYHDAAAALVVDGKLVAAIQEERLSRKKNDPSLPFRAARACLDIAQLKANDVDEVVFYEDPYARLEQVLVHTLRTFPRSFGMFPRAMAQQLGDKLWVLDELALGLAIDRAKVTHRSHHEAHAASAYFPSPFRERAAVLVVDGVGEDTSTSIWRGEGRNLDFVEKIEHPHSIGLLYAAVTAWLGFQVLEGEQKVMGLASFGTPTYVDEIRRVVRVQADGSFELDLDYFAHHTSADLAFGSKLETLLGPRRAPGTPWTLPLSGDDAKHADVAASLQLVVEEALVALAKRALASTGAQALCLAGGVALNACANARIRRETNVGMFVQPAAGDAGGALGAALLASLARGDDRVTTMTTAALGPDVDVADGKVLAEKLGLKTRYVDDAACEVAKLLNDGRVVASAQGRLEWGPRALGQRSLLALPTPVEVKHRINRAIKRREPFRPFAPAMRVERARQMLDDVNGSESMTQFMTTVCPVRDDAREQLAAVTHVDGTARLQTVSGDGFLSRVLDHVPCVLNTSLNGRREPMCATATDAIAFFVAHTDVDTLVIGDVVVER
jgi:carbamoyltransferase